MLLMAHPYIQWFSAIYVMVERVAAERGRGVQREHLQSGRAKCGRGGRGETFRAGGSNRSKRLWP
jgi:hypothetical protein